MNQIDFADFDQLIFDSIKIRMISQYKTLIWYSKALNFGHTLGHAIRDYFFINDRGAIAWEAIAVGMILESHISMQENAVVA
jgi:3-dehydroquinate synthase